MTRHFDHWLKANGGGINHHGVYNGMNLCGTDVARFFLDHRKNPNIHFSDFVASTEVYFRVSVPAQGIPDFVLRHPWLVRGDAGSAVSWDISFSSTGQPVAFTANQRKVQSPIITAIRPSKIPHRYLTRGLVSGQENRASLTQSGKRLVAIITDDFPISSDQPTD
jgi:hypothetical protein